jgi:hypothetical protein
MNIELFQNVATVVTFVAPGYFVIQVYSLMHAKRDREFSRLLVESVVYSFPIVAMSSVVWQAVFGKNPGSLEVGYIALLIGLAIAVGMAAGLLRMRWPIKQFARFLRIEEPNSDFLKSQLVRINASKSNSSALTVQLKSGAAFSGTIDRMTRYTHDGRPMYFSFTNIAWYNQASGKWDERKGNIIISRDEIEYIETGQLADI